jgi:ribosomal protein L37AE/L43A
MPDLVAISSILASLKTASELAKAMKASHTSVEQAEINFIIADLISALADAKIQVADVQSEILVRDSEIRALKEQLELQQNLVWEKPYYWLIHNDEKDGPYCQKCYDADNKLVRLQGGGTSFWLCKVCNSKFYDSNYEKPKHRTVKKYDMRWR